MQGAAAYFVQGLSNDDTVNLWRAFGVTGSRKDLIALFNTFGNYPLLIRALAGEVARFRPAPRDFAAWRQAHADFDPFSLPLVQRKTHILQYAFSGVTDTETRVLHTIAAFRAPATYDALAALLVGLGKPCPDEITLDVVLSDLENRGLVGWDRRGNRYDLHPVVRGVAWSGLDPRAKEGIYESLASHFEALPEIDDAIKTIDDLTAPIELYNTLARLHRAKDAYGILNDRILESYKHLSAFREFAELAELFFEEPGLMDALRRESPSHVNDLIVLLTVFYILAGDPAAALERIRELDKTYIDKEPDLFLSLKSLALCAIGGLAEAEQGARESLAIQQDWLVILTLAIVLIRRGQYEDGMSWLSDYRLDIEDEEYEGFFGALDLLESGITALRHYDISLAQAFAEQLGARAAKHGEGQYMIRVQAMSLDAAVAHAQGKHEQAYELLNNALVLARRGRLADSETGLLVQLAEWNITRKRLDDARRNVADAQQLAEHGQLKLRQIDALNMLSRIEHASGDHSKATSAATEAYRLAWCDGPPFTYDWGIRQARQNLAALDEPEPTRLPTSPSLIQMADPAISPISRTHALGLQPPLTDRELRGIMRQLPKGDDSASALRTWYESSAASSEIRPDAIVELARVDGNSDRVWHDLLKAVNDPSERVRSAALGLITRSGHPDARAVLTRLLTTEQDPEARQLLGELHAALELPGPTEDQLG